MAVSPWDFRPDGEAPSRSVPLILRKSERISSNNVFGISGSLYTFSEVRDFISLHTYEREISASPLQLRTHDLLHLKKEAWGGLHFEELIVTGKKVKCRLNSFSIMMYLIAMRCPSGVSKRKRCSSLRRNRLVCVFPICINYLRDGKSWALVDRNYDTRLIAVKEKISCDIPSLLLFLLLVSDDVTKLRRFCHHKIPLFYTIVEGFVYPTQYT